MTDRKVIQDKLRKKEQEIQALEEKVRAGRVYIQALQDVLKLLDPEPAGEVVESGLRAGSAVDKARETILSRGIPVHINELLKAVGKDLTRESRASLTSSLAAYVRRAEIFTRPAPNTFGLIELGHEAAEQSVRTPHPPQGFGRIVAASDPGGGVPMDDIDDEFGTPDDEIKF